MLPFKGTRLLMGAVGVGCLMLGLLCVRAGLVSWPPQSAIVKVLRHESVQQDLLALNDLARMGLLSEGELQWDDIEEAVGDTGGALVLGWASRRRRLKARREQALAPAEG